MSDPPPEPSTSAGVVWQAVAMPARRLLAFGENVLALQPDVPRGLSVWNARTGTERWRSGGVDEAVVGADGTIVAFGSDGARRLDPGDGGLLASHPVTPPPGGWIPTAVAAVASGVAVAHRDGLSLLDPSDLRPRWTKDWTREEPPQHVQVIGDGSDLLVVTRAAVTAFTREGEIRWRSPLPAGQRPIGGLSLTPDRGGHWLSLAPRQPSDPLQPTTPSLHRLHVDDGSFRDHLSLPGLTGEIPAAVFGDNAVVALVDGIAGVSGDPRLQISWRTRILARTTGWAATRGRLLLTTAGGELWVVDPVEGGAAAHGVLPDRVRWTPPAPDLNAGVHVRPGGELTAVAVTAHGIVVAARRRDGTGLLLGLTAQILGVR